MSSKFKKEIHAFPKSKHLYIFYLGVHRRYLLIVLRLTGGIYVKELCEKYTAMIKSLCHIFMQILSKELAVNLKLNKLFPSTTHM